MAEHPTPTTSDADGMPRVVTPRPEEASAVLDLADRAGAKFALVLGERELEAGEVAVKNLADHAQESVALDAEAVIRAVR